MFTRVTIMASLDACPDCSPIFSSCWNA